MQRKNIIIFNPDSKKIRNKIIRGFQDIFFSFQNYKICFELAKFDIKVKYKGSKIGPLWISISTFFWILCIGLLYSQVLKIDLKSYFPYLAIGFVTWKYISITLSEANSVLIKEASLFHELKVSYSIIILKMVFKNLLVLFLNFIPTYIIIVLMTGVYSFSIFDGFFLIFCLLISSFGASIVIGMINAKFRDFGELLETITQLLFFASPIIWNINIISNEILIFVLNLNPILHILSVSREIMLDGSASLINYLVTFFFSIFVFFVGSILFALNKSRINFWI